MREIFRQLFGNERLKATLGEAIENGVSSHAYILEGPRGSGKHTAAMLAAAALGCENKENGRFPLPCGVCPVCNRVLKGISADVITVSKDDKASIGVGKIRAIREDLYVTPNDSDKKVYIIEESDLMTPQAQNALLISLEEPPQFVTFFLLTENVEALLDTVKSRSVTIRMELFSPEKIKEYIETLPGVRKNSPDYEERVRRAIEESNGSPGEAKRIIEGPESKDENTAGIARQFAGLLITRKTSDALTVITPIAAEGYETSKKILSALSANVAGMIRFKKLSGTKNVNAFSPEEIESVRSVSLSRLVGIFDLTTEALLLVSSNVSPKNVFYDLIFKCRK